MPEDQSFENFMEDALEAVVVSPEPAPAPDPDPAPAPTPDPTPAEPAAPDPAAPDPEETGLLSDKLTKMLSGAPEPDPAAPAPDPAAPAPDPAAPDPADDKPPANATPAAQKRWAEMRQ